MYVAIDTITTTLHIGPKAVRNACSSCLRTSLLTQDLSMHRCSSIAISVGVYACSDGPKCTEIAKSAPLISYFIR